VDTDELRILYSFPQKLGADRVCYTAWQQVIGLAAAGVAVRARPGVLVRPVPPSVDVAPTLAWKQLRVSYKLVGRNRAFAVHDAVVARSLPRLAGKVDVVHTWPLGARRTLEAAEDLGIATVLERPNAHTRHAYDVVARESARIGVALPPGSEHAFDAEVLRIEEREYDLAGHLLCPSAFVASTFRDAGFEPHRLLRHSYGFDADRFRPPPGDRNGDGPGLTMLFAGYAAVRKGLHIALDAWLASPASERGTFLVAGDMLPAYRDVLEPQLAHPSVQVLGHRDDVPELMRRSDVFVLPTFEEGFPLACVESVASGCVPLVSEVCTDVCVDGTNALVHPVGDVEALREHLTLLDGDRELLQRLRRAALGVSADYTWARATERLVDAYRQALADR
jgi:glycosyltransferase involved in cell wall biosynthesis